MPSGFPEGSKEECYSESEGPRRPLKPSVGAKVKPDVMFACDLDEGPSFDQLDHLLSEVTSGPLVFVTSTPTRSLDDCLPLSPCLSCTPSRVSTARTIPAWHASRPSSRYSRSSSAFTEMPPILRLADDVLRYILSFLWPVRDLFSLRLTCKYLKAAAESLHLDCSMCNETVVWKDALVCDGCYVTCCRECAQLPPMPNASIIKKYVGARCLSCGGRLQDEWQCCPWCSTLRVNTLLQSSFHLQQTARPRKPRFWITHPCGHSMKYRRMCGQCTFTCSRCGAVACEQCIWCDGSRIACYSCTVTYGR